MMWDLDNWIIYDSYCAKGRSGSSVEGFPIAGTPNQKGLGFIYGSWFCKSIAERLNTISNNRFHWRPYHIEMIAFQLGHETD